MNRSDYRLVWNAVINWDALPEEAGRAPTGREQ
jgi:hypothetical protein